MRDLWHGELGGDEPQAVRLATIVQQALLRLSIGGEGASELIRPNVQVCVALLGHGHCRAHRSIQNQRSTLH
jgi:hypothetical protein